MPAGLISNAPDEVERFIRLTGLGPQARSPDLTNQATLRIWPMRITIFDIVWGAFATALAATVSFSVTAWSAQAAR